MNSFRSKNLCLKYEKFTPSAGKDIEIRKFEFVAKTQFLITKTTFHLVLEKYASIIV